MASLADILDALADTIRDVLQDVDQMQVEPRFLLYPQPPSVDMWPADPSADQELRGFADLIGAPIITIRARVGTADDYAAQDLLLELMDDETDLSVMAAVMSDPTLKGTAASVEFLGRSGMQPFPLPQGEGVLLGCTWQFEVTKAYS